MTVSPCKTCPRAAWSDRFPTASRCSATGHRVSRGLPTQGVHLVRRLDPPLAPSGLGGSDAGVRTELAHRHRDIVAHRPRRQVGAFSDNPDRGTVQDRKSTRLNSSHVAISYAVFCLK